MSRVSSAGNTVDRSLGLIVTVTGTVAAVYAIKWIHDAVRLSAKPAAEGIVSSNTLDGTIAPVRSIDHGDHMVIHTGCCHCQRVSFNIYAPKVLNAVDISSKIRFPRITIVYEDFELLTDAKVLSMYSVQSEHNGSQESNSNTPSPGVYSFCSYCGMHILYAPSVDPIEVQVNVDCLAADNIEQVHLAYHSAQEVVAANSVFDQRGHGAMTLLPALQPLFTHRQSRRGPLASATAAHGVAGVVLNTNTSTAVEDTGMSHYGSGKYSEGHLMNHPSQPSGLVPASTPRMEVDLRSLHSLQLHQQQHQQQEHQQIQIGRNRRMHSHGNGVAHSISSFKGNALNFRAPARQVVDTMTSSNAFLNYSNSSSSQNMVNMSTNDFYSQHYSDFLSQHSQMTSETEADDHYSGPSPLPSDSGDSHFTSHTQTLSLRDAQMLFQQQQLQQQQQQHLHRTSRNGIGHYSQQQSSQLPLHYTANNGSSTHRNSQTSYPKSTSSRAEELSSSSAQYLQQQQQHGYARNRAVYASPTSEMPSSADTSPISATSSPYSSPQHVDMNDLQKLKRHLHKHRDSSNRRSLGNSSTASRLSASPNRNSNSVNVTTNNNNNSSNNNGNSNHETLVSDMSSKSHNYIQGSVSGKKINAMIGGGYRYSSQPMTRNIMRDDTDGQTI